MDCSSGSRGGPRGPWPPPGPVKIGHKKDGRRRRPHRFHVSRPPLTRPLDPLLDWRGCIKTVSRTKCWRYSLSSMTKPTLPYSSLSCRLIKQKKIINSDIKDFEIWGDLHEQRTEVHNKLPSIQGNIN